MWFPFSRKFKHLENLMSQKIAELQAQLDSLAVLVHAAAAEHAKRRSLLLDQADQIAAQGERIAALEAQLAAAQLDADTDAGLDALSVQISAISATLNPPPTPATPPESVSAASPSSPA